ncbi:putative aspartic-type endopeptidase opsB [Colletotrichum spaethianum]|uniref:Aspartic-type endopeptidase opsB n=1 Tax=Colletotrichum spaethianum TaxID=700344 RepID=A0AA37L679_9PEZI|nr:putative aspartic-type endopeptidase opsB [Colletotrichum spaethianum]GKT42628.1 putative aspartic-type endopeptidase opsB [Colletotrichum spaethianum]
MKLFATFALLALVEGGASQKVVSASFHRVQFPLDLVQITRRETLDLAALNNITGGGYYSEVKVGTPGQKALMHIDTGSSDTWVVDKQADLCNSRSLQRQYQTGCTATFNSSESSTYKLVSTNGFDITYLDGKNIQGDYIQDVISFDGKTIKDQQMGLAIQTVKSSGLMGLGFSENVATRRQYPTILDNMVTQGQIGRKAYSIWLNDLSASEGTVLFGGVDTEKYIGKLTTLPLVKDYHSGNITSYSVALTGLAIETPDGKAVEMAADSFNAAAVLDSGSTVCLLPENLTKSIWAKYGVIDAGYGFIDCKWGGAMGEGHYIDFELTGVKIRVALEEMVLDNLNPIMDQLEGLTPFDKPCMFGIQNNAVFDVTSDKFAILGDTFLRSAYVVYDETNRQVGIAQSNLNSSRSNIIELRANGTVLPTVTGVASQTTTPAPTRTAGESVTRLDTITTAPVTPTPSESANAASHQGAMSSRSDGSIVMLVMSVFAIAGVMLLVG